MNYKIIEITKNEITKIKPLWEELNLIHLNDSHYFKDHFASFTFEKRTKKFYEINDEKIKIDIVENTDNEEIIGYCISTIDKMIGKINSLFIRKNYRKHGLGKTLVENGINWLKNKNCEKIRVAVAEGHESAFSFYEKLGFYPRMTYLELKK